MNEINFIASGMMGDFIQSLYAVKNICSEQNAKANIYLANGYHGDIWTHGIEKAYSDSYQLITNQPYINTFSILPENFSEPFINLNLWRIAAAKTHAETGTYNKCWSELLSEQFNFKIPVEYQWITTDINEKAKGKMVIHRSKHRHNGEFPWAKITENNDCLFLTTNKSEWDLFAFKNANVKLLLVETISELAQMICGCGLFIGNQSAPFSIASALDVPRIVELDYDPAKFYMDEVKYSKNISWFLNTKTNLNKHQFIF